MQRIELVGQRFGKLLVTGISDSRTPKGEIIWRCICECGAIHNARGGYLRDGTSKSCGCLKKPHGMTMTPTWRSWRGMLSRCNDRNRPRFKDYGGRGIKVCERWMTFENFFADMGERPNGMSIDRYPNNNGNYEPSNCRWATKHQQQLNRRKSVIVECVAKLTKKE